MKNPKGLPKKFWGHTKKTQNFAKTKKSNFSVLEGTYLTKLKFFHFCTRQSAIAHQGRAPAHFAKKSIKLILCGNHHTLLKFFDLQSRLN
jgi:hypothetical protein